MISNPGFEEGKTGWTSWGATFTTSNDAHSGSKAALISNRKNPWDALVKDISNIIENDKLYKLSAWVKIPDAAKNFRITIQLDVDGTKSYHGFARTENPVIGQYTRYEAEVQLSWNGNLKGANMYFETESVGGVYSDYLVDDVELTQYTPPQDIIQTGKGWKDIRSTMLVGGCVTDGNKNYFTNEAAKAQVLKDCNTVNIQAYAAWGRWDKNKRHVYHLDEFTSQVKEMKEKNMRVTMHMLLGWDKYFPEWFRKNDFPVDTLDALMKSWLKAIITDEGNDTLVDVWNVVNESIAWDGKGGYWPVNHANFESACEFQRMGFEADASGLTGDEYVNAEHPVYIRKAFEYARTLTDKKLELRETSCEFPNSQKYDAFYQLAVHLKNMNAPVDVIGFQSHIDIQKNYDWEGYENNIKRFVDLGYEVVIPEVDVGDIEKNWTPEKEQKQKEQYYKMVTAAIRGGASDFQTWGFIDGGKGWRVGEKAFPYTNIFEAKPAYYGIMEALTDLSSILYWEMDEAMDNKIPDVLTYNNFGNLNNFEQAQFVDGYIGKALLFDGSDDLVSTEVLSESVNENLTFSCYIKTGSKEPQNIARLISDVNTELRLGVNKDGKLELSGSGDELQNSIIAPDIINGDNWHFIALQREGSTYKLFVNDTIVAASGQGEITKINKLALGAMEDGSVAFKGSMDEVKLFDSLIDGSSFMRSFATEPAAKLKLNDRGMMILLTWDDKSNNEAGFIIERKEGDGEWEEIARVEANKERFTEELSTYETEFFYRVRTFTTAGKTYASNEVSFQTPKDPTTGMENLNKINLKVFPNPAQNKLNFQSTENYSFNISDMQGRMILQKVNCKSEESIDISDLRPGLYLINAYNNKGSKVIKVIKTANTNT